MSGFLNDDTRNLVLFVALGALAACETMPAAKQADTPAPAPAAMDEATGAGEYFPLVSSFETPDIRFGQMANAGAEPRQLFVDQLNLAAISQGRKFPIVAQAVGENGETLVFMNLDGEWAMTPYLARGILARLTSITRFAPAIAEMGLSSEFDIYNMAAVLGFARIIVTDGRDFAHEARLTKN